jgi:copper chaperone CopZ
MHCEACARKVARALKGFEGVLSLPPLTDQPYYWMLHPQNLEIFLNYERYIEGFS